MIVKYLQYLKCIPYTSKRHIIKTHTQASEDQMCVSVSLYKAMKKSADFF